MVHKLTGKHKYVLLNDCGEFHLSGTEKIHNETETDVKHVCTILQPFTSTNLPVLGAELMETAKADAHLFKEYKNSRSECVSY